MTAQEIFNKVYRHLLAQGERSTNVGFCCYRDLSGRKCAVGCLIPDDMYDQAIEGANPERALLGQDGGTLYETPDEALGEILAELGFTKDHAELLDSLRLVHDTALPQEWPDELARVARIYGLQVPA